MECDMAKRRRKIRPGGKPVEKPESKSRFREILEARMLNTEDDDLDRTTRPSKLPRTTPPEL